jgi:lysozyme family protein
MNFDLCVNEVLKSEGGYSNNPKDPGGPTKYGITLLDYRAFINKNGTARDVKNLSVDQAKSIYKSKYWDALACDTLPPGVDYSCFDYGVNSGVGRPRKALQRFKKLSGIALIDAINNERTAFLRSLSTYSTFGKGWLTRVEHVRKVSKEMFLRKDVTSAPMAALTVGGLAATCSSVWQHHELLFIVTGVTTAAVIGLAVHLYRNKGK